MNFIKYLNSVCEKLEKFIIAYGIIVMAVVAIINVMGRNLFHYSFSWVEEVTQFSVVLVTFVGTAYAARAGAHIRMSVLSDFLGHGGKKFLALTVSLGTALLMLYLAWYAGVYVKSLYTMKKYTLGLQIPVYIVMLWVPVGFVMAALQYIATFIQNVNEKGPFVAPGILEGQNEENFDV